MTNYSKLRDQVNTWPVRIKRVREPLFITPKTYDIYYKHHIMSLDIIPDLSGNGNCILTSFESKTIKKCENKVKEENLTSNQTLDSLLESLPLVYNPSTKQLHVIKLKSKEDSPDKLCNNSFKNKFNSSVILNFHSKDNSEFTRDECCELIPKSESQLDGGFNYDAVPSENLKRTLSDCTNKVPVLNHIRNQSETISFESASSVSSSTPETCSLASPTVSPRVKSDSSDSKDLNTSPKKKRGITGFFTRNLFPWKSKDERKAPLSQYECDGDSVSSDISSVEESSSSSWKLFTKVETISPHSSEIITHEVPAGSVGLIMEERPDSLPAKTPIEQEKHKQEYKNIVSAARKKDLKEAKDRRKAQAMQLKQEKYLSDSVHTWNTQLIPKWATMRNQKKCQELWWAGLPSCIRGKVWKLAIGNELNITPQLYSNLVKRSVDKLSYLSMRKVSDYDGKDFGNQTKNRESTLNLIQLDVSRTFPHLCIFQDGGPYHDPLHNILGAYVSYRPDVGYVQGMSFLAATFLLNMEESNAFTYFANLINRSPHMAFFTVDQRIMQAYYSTFEEFFKENLLQLANHLRNLNVYPNMYFLDWVLTVFSRSFPLDVAARIWDIYLRDGEEFLFRAAIGILRHFEKELLTEDCTAHAAQFLIRLPEDLNVELLFKDIAAVSLTSSSKKTLKEVLDENLCKAACSV